MYPQQRKKTALLLVAAAAFFALAGSAILLINKHQNQKPPGRRRRFKINPKNSRARLRTKSQYHYLKEMKSLDEVQFFNHTRMTRPVFDKLLQMIRPMICRQRRSDGITGELRLFITLKYLSQGTTMQNLACIFEIGFSTVHLIINETCKAIWDVLHSEYLKPPTKEQWLDISKGFKDQCKFPNCLGAIDGKHINFQASNPSLENVNIVLLAACDSQYRFTMFDIGVYESQKNGSIVRDASFGVKLNENVVPANEESLLPNTNSSIPYYFVGKEAFPLKTHVLRAYPSDKNLNNTQELFNKHHNTASKAIENAFGILVSRWSVLKLKINAKLEKIDNIVKSVMALHNYCLAELQKGDENLYCPKNYVDHNDEDIQDGEWRLDHNPLLSVGRMASRRQKKVVYNMRDTLAEYFMTTHFDAGFVMQD